MDVPSEVRKPGIGRLRRVSAVLVTLLLPGAGHFLLGAFRRGVVWAVGLVLVGLLLLFAAPVSITIVTNLVAGVLGRIAAAIDAGATPGARPSWKIVAAAWTALLVGRAAMHGVIVEPTTRYYATHYAQGFTIPTGGMEPTLLIGDHIMVDRSAYRDRAPQRSDIVVFSYPPDETRDFIKRIIGLPGDVVDIRGRQVVVNGQTLIEPYIQFQATTPTSTHCTYAYGCEATRVPADSYFVMGDSRDNSQDSRYFGFVKREQIKGKAHVIYWSWDVEQRLRTDRIGRYL